MSRIIDFEVYKRSLLETANAANIADCWVSRENVRRPPTVMCTGTELGTLRLEHRFRQAKTAHAHESLLEEQDDLWIFSILLEEFERLFKRGV